MSTNSPNKKLTSQSSNAFITMEGKPGDEALSSIVTLPGTVTISDTGITSYNHYMDGNKHIVDFSWPDNRNEQGSITGNIDISTKKSTFANSGDSSEVNFGGLKYTGSSDQRSIRSAKPKIKITIPKNTDTADVGGTYMFDTYMESWDGFIRGIYQSAYNEENPYGLLELTTKNSWITVKDSTGVVTSTFEYQGGNLVKTPVIYVDGNLPSAKYGNASGNQNLNTKRFSDNIDKYVITSTNNNESAFITTKADISNANVSSRSGSVNYKFTKFNSKDSSELNGSFIINQAGGKISITDPIITYNWSIEDKDNVVKTSNINWNTCEIDLKPNKGEKSVAYGDIICGPIKQGYPGFQQYYGEIDLGGNITYSLAKNSSNHQVKVNSKITVTAVDEDTISNKDLSYTIVQSGSSYTIVPEFALKVTVEDTENNSTYTIPGTNNVHPSLLISSTGNDGTFATSTYLYIKGQQGKQSSQITEYPKLYYKFGDNRPIGVINGSINGNVLITPDLFNFNYKGGTANVNIDGTGLTFAPTKSIAVKGFNWRVSSEIYNKSNSEGTVNKFDSFTASQAPIEESNQTYGSLNITLEGPSETSTVNLTKDNKKAIKSFIIPSNELKYKYYKVTQNSAFISDDESISSGIISGGLDYDDENTKLSKEITRKITLGTDINSVSLSKTEIPITIGAEDIEGSIEFRNTSSKYGNRLYVKSNDSQFKTLFDSPLTLPLSNPKKSDLPLLGQEYEKYFNYYVNGPKNSAEYDTSKIEFNTEIISGQSNNTDYISSEGGQVKLTLTNGTNAIDGEDISGLQISYRLIDNPKYLAKANKTNSSEGVINIPKIEGEKALKSSSYKGYYKLDIDRPGVLPSKTWHKIAQLNDDNYCIFDIGPNLPVSSSSSISYVVSDNSNSLLNKPFKFTFEKGSTSSTKIYTFKIFDENANEYSTLEKQIRQLGAEASNTSQYDFEVISQNYCNIECDPLIVSSDEPEKTGPVVHLTLEEHPKISNSLPNKLPDSCHVSQILTLNPEPVTIDELLNYTGDTPAYTISWGLLGGYNIDNKLYLLGDYTYSATACCSNNKNYIAGLKNTKSGGLYGDGTTNIKYKANIYWQDINNSYYYQNSDPDYKYSNTLWSLSNTNNTYTYGFSIKNYNHLPPILYAYDSELHNGPVASYCLDYKIYTYENFSSETPISNNRLKPEHFIFKLNVLPAKYKYGVKLEPENQMLKNEIITYTAFDEEINNDTYWKIDKNIVLNFYTSYSTDNGENYRPYKSEPVTYNDLYNEKNTSYRIYRNVFDINLCHETEGTITYGSSYESKMIQGIDGNKGYGSQECKRIISNLKISLKDDYNGYTEDGYKTSYSFSCFSEWKWYGRTYYNQ